MSVVIGLEGLGDSIPLLDLCKWGASAQLAFSGVGRWRAKWGDNGGRSMIVYDL